mmetsp:Transcript_19510/g.42153  ORF Transcript_19510/g.42153 Transcript_19510/m.42153 type:complete len:187 (-) Transcript_19510:85-645(-)
MGFLCAVSGWRSSIYLSVLCLSVCVSVDASQSRRAHAGDSHGVLCRSGRAVALTTDHKPNDPDEKNRIVQAGGFVIVGRVNGELAVSRALGDWAFKRTPGREHVSAIPDVKVDPITEADEFVILACDGLWDVTTNQEAVNIVIEIRQRGGSANAAAKRLVQGAVKVNPLSADNVSVVVVYLRPHHR